STALKRGFFGGHGGGGGVLLVFFLGPGGVDAGRWLDWILNPPRRSFKLRVLVDRQRPMKNVTFDRATRARDLFSRVLLLHHPLRDFGRICCRVLNLPGCLAFEEHVHPPYAGMQRRKSLRLSCRD